MLVNSSDEFSADGGPEDARDDELEVVLKLTEAMSFDEAVRWLYSPNPGLNGQTPPPSSEPAARQT